MPIQINTTQGQIGINTTWGNMSIEQPRGQQTINTTMPKVKIQTERPRVIIDQYQCFAEAGLKNMSDLTRENSQIAYQEIMKSIARIANDGNRLAMIGKNMPDAIPELAEKNAWTPEREFNIETIPKSRPKIDVVGDIQVDYEPGSVNIDYRPMKPIIDYQRGKVEIYLKQKPSVEIRYIDERI